MKAGATWSLLAVYLVLAVAAVALVVFQGGSASALGALGFAGFAGVGSLIALRRPGNAVGWLLLVIAIAFSAGEVGGVYVAEPSNPARIAAAWITTCATNAWFTLALVFLPLVFPHGRLPSPRWRPVLWLAAADLALGVAGSGLTPGPLETGRIENPLGVGGGLPEAATRLEPVVGAVAVVLAAASVVVRFRASRSAERQQLKWFAYIGVLAAICLFVAVILGSLLAEDAPAGADVAATVAWLSGLALVALGLPAAAGLAILRHRLYDVDVVIRRTLVYAALTITLGGTYLGLVLLAGLAVGRSGLAVAVSTLAVAALFRPALARIQAVVDQRFYRRRYDAQQTLAMFSARLRNQIELDAVSGELRAVVAQAVQPAGISLLLRSDR